MDGCGLLCLPNDVLRLIVLLLPSNSLLSLRMAMGRRTFAIDDSIFGVLLSRLTTLQPTISEAAVASALSRIVKKPLFLTRRSSSLQLVRCVSQAKSELLARRVHAAAYRDARQSVDTVPLCTSGFLAETCHFLSDDEVFFAGKGLLRCSGLTDKSTAPATERCAMPFPEALFVSTAIVLEGGTRMLLGANTGSLGLLTVARGEPLDTVGMERWEVSGAAPGLGISREISALNVLPRSSVLVTTASHWIEQRDLETQAVLSTMAANKMQCCNKRVGWRNQRGKLQDTVLLDANVMAVSGEENLMVCDLRCGAEVVALLNSNAARRGHTYCIRSLAHEAHGGALFSGGGDGIVCRWDLRNTEQGPMGRAMTDRFVVDVRVDCDNVFVSHQARGSVQQFSRSLQTTGLALGEGHHAVLSFDVRADAAVACFDTGLVNLYRVGGQQ